MLTREVSLWPKITSGVACCTPEVFNAIELHFLLRFSRLRCYYTDAFSAETPQV